MTEAGPDTRSNGQICRFEVTDIGCTIKGGSNGLGNNPVQSTCVNYFTDIHDVMKAVGKDIHKK
ncbi:hypothetical protein [Nonomuraea sp. NPDC049607]|uniref:hypothetical protein n=1 Tax=Nonomuraea sp. NPDC049607 TaxID=3154732 RepID=UPI003425B24E